MIVCTCFFFFFFSVPSNFVRLAGSFIFRAEICKEWKNFYNSYTCRSVPDGLESSNPQYEQYTANIITQFIQELESKAASLNTEDLFLTKLKLMEAAKNFRVNIVHTSYNIDF